MLKPRHIFALLLCIPGGSFLKGQQHPANESYQSRYRYANQLYNSKRADDKTDSLAAFAYRQVIAILANSGEQDSILFDAYVKAGILQLGGRDNPKTLNFFLSAIHLQQKNKSIPDSLLFQPYLFSGTSYYDLNALDSAKEYYRKAEQLVSKYPGTRETERLYNKYGVLFYETGDYEKSIHYFTKALSIVQAHSSPNTYFVVNYKNNIASAFRKLGEYDQALAIYQGLLSYNIRRDELMHNIGVTYLAAGKYAEAISYLEKVPYQNISKSNDLAQGWLLLNRPDSAGNWLDLADRQYQAQGSPAKNFDYAATLQRRGDWQIKKGFPELALKNYQQAIISIDPDFNDENITHNPSSFHGLHNLSAFFSALTGKGRAFLSLYQRQHDVGSMTNAFAAYESALLLAAHVQRTYTSDESRLFLANETGPVYQEAVELALKLYSNTRDEKWLEKAFSYSENSKASVLQAGLQELELSSMPGLPTDLLGEEKKLKEAISKWNMELDRLADSATMVLQQKKILDAEIRLSALQDKLEQNPRYYLARFTNRDNHIREIQQKIIRKDESILSYYYLRDNLLCFYITKETFGFKTIQLSETLHGNILALRAALRGEEGIDPKLIRNSSNQLFEQLVKPVMDMIKSKKRLVVIPHNEISFIPFECLQDSSDEMPLLGSFSISYQYSINFLQNNKNFPEHQYEVLGIAPYAAANTKQDLPMLPSSGIELEQLSGKILMGPQATKSAFLQYASEYPFIHLATHAFASDQNPLQSFIAFYGDTTMSDTLQRLYEQEIYHLDLHSSRLVILSACETGSGHLIHGEGIMSLSRAFSYAGCPAVVTSLWKADDAATAFIMQRLHHYLKQGYRTDESLQMGKLDYLESGQFDTRKKTPAYWAHLVLIGDNGEIYRKSYAPFWLLAVVAGIIWLLMRRKKTGREKRPV